MPASDGGRQHRRLRLAVRELRSKAGLTQHQVATAMEWSVSKVVRIENGDVRISVSDLRNLLSLYGLADEAARDEILDLARQARHQPWRAFRDVHSPAFLRYLSYEATAARIWEVQPAFIPGLFQTEAYCRALLSQAEVVSREQARIDRLWQARTWRQQIINGPSAPEITLFLDESAVLRVVGGPEVMLEQLAHLLALARLDTVSLRIVPLSAGLYPGVRVAFARLGFDDASEADVLYVENPGSDIVTRDDPAESSVKSAARMADYVRALDHLDSIALSDSASQQLIRDVRQALTLWTAATG
jgi:transcriptional regulator with XRE-family HTH domain